MGDWGDVSERVPDRETWSSPTLDQPDEVTLAFSAVAADPAFQELILSGREVGLAPGSDNSAVLLVALDRPATFKTLLPGHTLGGPDRFDRVWIKRPASLASSSKLFVIQAAPRPGMLNYTTTPNPSVTSGAGASATQVQGTQADAAALTGNPVTIAGKDNAGNARIPAVVPAGAAGGTPNAVVTAGQDGTGVVRVPSVVVQLGTFAAPNVAMVGGIDQNNHAQAVPTVVDGNGTASIRVEACGNEPSTGNFLNVSTSRPGQSLAANVYPLTIGAADPSALARVITCDAGGRLLVVHGINDTLSAAGQATQPAAGAALATIAAPGAGTYRVEVETYQDGTIDTASLADMELRHGATVVGKVLSGRVGARAIFERVTINAAEAITVNATAQPAAASVFVAAIRATRIF